MLKLLGRRRHTSKLIWVLIVLLIFLVSAGVFGYTRPLPVISPNITLKLSTPSGATLAWPSGGEAAIGALGYGTIMTAGTQTPEPTASVAKLITALAVLNKYPLEPGQSGPTITLTAADVAIYKQYVAEDGSVVLVQAGEQITEYQALEAMMLPSANNIADSLAIWAFGSLANYSTFANQFVTTLGLAQTHIGSDASGFLPNTTSTASDLVALGLDAIKNPVLAAITSEAKATLPLAGTVDNVNWLLGEDGIFGIKTGNSNQAGGVYIFAAHDSIDANHIVTVVGALQGIATLQDALDQAVPLLNSVKQNFALSEVVQANQIVGYYKTPWGSATPAATKNSLTAVIWKGVPLQPTVSLTPLRSPESNGSLAGQLSLNSAGESLSVPIDLTQPIPKPPLLWRICHHKLDL